MQFTETDVVQVSDKDSRWNSLGSAKGIDKSWQVVKLQGFPVEVCGQVLRFADGVAADVTFWRHKGTTALPRLEPEAEACGDRKGASHTAGL